MESRVTQDWKAKRTPKALLVGHDPRLNHSDTIAEYALFANYFFQSRTPNSLAEKKKYNLAKSSFEQVSYLTLNKIRPEEIYVTNLCNYALPHAPKGKIVFIPELIARKGVENIKQILINNPTIKYIFPMSLQVNYWLQKLAFYREDEVFVRGSEPKLRGIQNYAPYYEPSEGRTFLSICGKQYHLYEGEQILIPILHSKNYPLKGKLIAYLPCYEKIMEYFKAN